jgi:hypothetical protein
MNIPSLSLGVMGGFRIRPDDISQLRPAPSLQCRYIKLSCYCAAGCIQLDQFCSQVGGGMASEPGGGAACYIRICEFAGGSR